MIYAHLNMTPDAPKFEQPPKPDFYLRMYQGDDGPIWLKEYWDGAQWYYVKGGSPARVMNREWREIQTKGE